MLSARMALRVSPITFACNFTKFVRLVYTKQQIRFDRRVQDPPYESSTFCRVGFMPAIAMYALAG